ELGADRRDVPHRRVEPACVEERNPDLVVAATGVLGPEIDLDAERFEEIRSAELAECRAASVLRDLGVHARRYDRRRGRDAEHARTVAAGPAGVDERTASRRHPLDVPAHRPRRADELGDRLPLAAERREERTDEPG